jgi:hypothetical protein
MKTVMWMLVVLCLLVAGCGVLTVQKDTSDPNNPALIIRPESGEDANNLIGLAEAARALSDAAVAIGAVSGNLVSTSAGAVGYIITGILSALGTGIIIKKTSTK